MITTKSEAYKLLVDWSDKDLLFTLERMLKNESKLNREAEEIVLANLRRRLGFDQ